MIMVYIVYVQRTKGGRLATLFFIVVLGALITVGPTKLSQSPVVLRPDGTR